MAEAALTVAIVAALAAVASAVAAHRSRRAAEHVVAIETDRRHDELAPKLELLPHKHTVYLKTTDGYGNHAESYRMGGMLTNQGPRSFSVIVRWEGEVHQGDGDALQPTGLVNFRQTPAQIVRELELGSLAVGEGRWFQCTGSQAGDNVVVTIVASDAGGRTWEQRIAMRWPRRSDRWHSTSTERE